MCRSQADGGQRCDAAWEHTHQERYNARRRVTRNATKATAARALGDQAAATKYEQLAAAAATEDETLTAQIREHEATHPTPDTTATKCPSCGRFAGTSHHCPSMSEHSTTGTPDSDPPASDAITAPAAGNDAAQTHTPEPSLDYRMEHQAPFNDTDTDDPYYNHIGNLTESFPEDVYDHPDWYGTVDEETLTQLQGARDDPDATVTIYRAVPADHDEINKGDWVTLSREYAENHTYDLESDHKDGTVVSAVVPASHVWTDGNDLAEFGYDGPTHLHHLNTPNPVGHASDSGMSPVTDSPATDPTSEPELVTDTAPAATPVAGAHPLAAKPADPVNFEYIRNTTSLSSNQARNHDFGQDVEPAGRYMTEKWGSSVPEGWETGTVQFTQPLHVNFGGSYTEETNWKQRLSAHYDGKTGQALSEAVRADGYDAIITHDKYGLGEVVDLTGLPSTVGTPTPEEATPRKTRTRKPGTWDRRRKYSSKAAADFGTALQERYGDGVQVWLRGGPDDDSFVSMSKILIPKEKRGQGIGKKIMSDLVSEADRNGWSLSLTPDGEWGSSVTRLRKFYGEFGFVNNKGRNKDFRTQDSMLRRPAD